jgi:hypothetical protein
VTPSFEQAPGLRTATPPGAGVRRLLRFFLTIAVLIATLSGPPPAAASPSASRDAVLDRAVALMGDEQWPALIALLEPAHRGDPADDDVALLLAIAYFRTDRGDDAVPLFRRLAAHPDAEVAATATLFLGLLARAGGDEADARRLFEQVASDSALLGDSAQTLLAAGRSERISAALAVRAGADSNVPLVSSHAIGPGSSSADLDLQVSGAVVGRPLGDAGVLLHAAGAFRKQARLTDLDLVAGRAGASYATASPRVRLGLGYAFEVDALGGALLGVGHAVDARARLLGRRWLETSYALRLRDYHRAEYTGYSGHLHRGGVELGARYRGGEAGVAAIGEGEWTRDPDVSGWAGGGRLRATLRRERLALAGSAEVLGRWLGARRDLRGEVRASAAYELGAHTAAVVGVSGLINESTEPAFDHVKVAVHAGVELRL